MGDYPRDPGLKDSKKSWLGCGASVALLAMGFLSCTCGGAQLLAEGHTGPMEKSRTIQASCGCSRSFADSASFWVALRFGYFYEAWAA